MWTYEFYHSYFGWLRVDREWPDKSTVESIVKHSPYKCRIVSA